MATLQASTRRKALKAHTFEDGPHVPAGNLVCIPSYSIMHDAALYPNPQVFNGFRFAAPAAAAKKTEKTEGEGEGQKIEARHSKVTDVDLTFPFWGYGKEAW